jgi:hypothetical protein
VPFTANLVGIYEIEEPRALQLFAALLAINALLLGWFIWSAEKDNGGATAWSRSVVHHLAIVPVLAVITIVLAGTAPAWTLVIWGIESIVVVVVLVTSGGSQE